MDSFDSLPGPVAHILEIEARQDEALQQLSELELRLEQVLNEYLVFMGKSPMPFAHALPASPKLEAA